MRNIIPRIAAVHDISGFGRASLTVIIPILSNMGFQVCPVPTAVLSTHTGGFKDFQFIDLTPQLQAYIDHWKSLNLKFDAIYSGFLGSEEQIDIVRGIFKDFKREDQLKVIDPVMGDDGKRYQTVTDGMVKGMRQLISEADIITPNITEASFLLERKIPTTITDEEIKAWLKELSTMGPIFSVITSVP